MIMLIMIMTMVTLLKTVMSVSQVVQLLLRHKADVNFVNEHGNSAMHYACFWGYTGGWSYLSSSS